MSKSNNVNKKLWRIHNWVGLYAGIVIAILSVTGVVALFKVEIDRVINPRLFKIENPDSQATIHPDVNKLIDSLKNEYGAKNFFQLSTSLDKSVNWSARFNVVKRKPIPTGHAYEIFFNPYTAKVVGQRNYFETFAHYIRHIHVRLFVGLGRYWVGLGGLALLVSTITGILIYGEFMKRQFFGAIRNKNLKLKSADYHKIIGVTTLLFNLMISFTGMWLGLQSILQPALQIKSPERYSRPEKPITKEEDIAQYVDFVKAYQVSRSLFPDLVPKQIRHSKNGNRTITIRGDISRTAYQSNVNNIILDKEDYSKLSTYDVRQKTLGVKTYYAQEGLHYGDFGGLWVKLIYTVFGLASGALSIFGFILYLERTKNKQKKKPKFKTALKKVWLWSLWLTVICVFLYVLTATIGVNIPTGLITLALYGSILFFAFKYLFLFLKRKYKTMTKKRV